MEDSQILGNYKLLTAIGQGGMGEVWRAEHVTLGRTAAVKLIRADLLGAGDARQRLLKRFEREAKATANLTSPHVVTVHDLGVTGDGSLWYAMELLDGLDLDTLVRRHGAVSPARVVHWLAQACEALSEAHGHGIIHRDIKPANLFVCRQGMQRDFLKIVDFGLALPVLEAGDGRLTTEGTIAGSPAWIAPEAALGDAIDYRADLYGLGCVAYWLLTGLPVFESDQPLRQVMAHVGSAPVRPSERSGQPLPDDLQDAIMACLAKKPSDRPASAAALRAQVLACALETWSDDDAMQWWQRHPQIRDVASGAYAVEAADVTGETAASFELVVAAAAAPAVVTVYGLAPMPAEVPLLPPVAAPPADAPITRPSRSNVPVQPLPKIAPRDLSLHRAQVVMKLRDHFTHSTLDMDAFELRVAQAEQAKDVKSLDTLLDDLPAPPQAPAAPPLPAAPATTGQEMAPAAASNMVAIFSGLERGNGWVPPKKSQVFCVFGGAEFDLRDSVLPPGMTEIHFTCVFGGAKIDVPDGVPVVVEGVGIMGAFSHKGYSDPVPTDPNVPWLKISGLAMFGGVDVRSRGSKRKMG